ncbi:hypothetical protein [Celeribacter naphthalenivorans]|uniref:hypothetical protein n=1 Tax=Celeribacter naphthalenivorans TaxID=1614694 RepID=UPI001CFA1C70|nr:hypothetical protein [Celeribacter naphthalenivorans]
MAKIAVEFTKVKGSFVTGDRAAFSDEKVKALEKGGFVRRLTGAEVAAAREVAGKSSTPLNEMADLKERLGVASGEIAAARNAEAKAVQAAETAKRERDTVQAQLDVARAELDVLKAQVSDGAQDAKAGTQTVAATVAEKTEAAKATGTPPKQGATK